MKEILGLFVLASPFSFILLIMLISIVIALIFSKKLFGKKRRVFGGIGIVVLTYFGLTGQEIVGGMYHEYLCENEAGWKNHKKIKLPNEHWNLDGTPSFVDENGEIQYTIINGWFITKSTKETYIDSFIKIDKLRFIYVDKKTNNSLGEKIDFTRYYGWIKEYSPAPNIGEGCNTVLIRKYGRDKYRKKYKQEHNDFILNLFTK